MATSFKYRSLPLLGCNLLMNLVFTKRERRRQNRPFMLACPAEAAPILVSELKTEKLQGVPKKRNNKQ